MGLGSFPQTERARPLSAGEPSEYSRVQMQLRQSPLAEHEVNLPHFGRQFPVSLQLLQRPKSLPDVIRLTFRWQKGMPDLWKQWLYSVAYWNAELED